MCGSSLAIEGCMWWGYFIGVKLMPCKKSYQQDNTLCVNALHRIYSLKCPKSILVFPLPVVYINSCVIFFLKVRKVFSR